MQSLFWRQVARAAPGVGRLVIEEAGESGDRWRLKRE
jgi:hypothetical protein